LEYERSIIPAVAINLLEGRSIDQKRQTAKRVTDVTAEVVDVKPESV